ncbi:uncharacterized protein LOC132501057 [Mesoplodon densirostris]|uniref:uncharacterized protein LOC132501057 n=1 Tax=Mesoplodon densirostris TaxID=48708 RepID=UPI0028DB4BA1|nr:uncharacterized protein LOC132501057 [Mesoplodon densirostris]
MHSGGNAATASCVRERPGRRDTVTPGECQHTPHGVADAPDAGSPVGGAVRAAGQAGQRRAAESTPASRSPVEPGQGGWLPDSRADESAPEIIRLGPSGTAENRRESGATASKGSAEAQVVPKNDGAAEEHRKGGLDGGAGGHCAQVRWPLGRAGTVPHGLELRRPESVLSPWCQARAPAQASLTERFEGCCSPKEATFPRKNEGTWVASSVCSQGCQKWHPGGFPGGAVVEGLPANAGDMGSSAGVGGSHMPRSN